jgi:DtxR family transcriptional regulator, Mn-dependent transcriptional regulator
MEDYLKAIISLADEQASGEGVQMQALAERLGVSGASVTAMVKRLAACDLVVHAPYRSVAPTPRGEAVALEVIRHHRLLELFLVDELGLPWDRVHAEADRLEHHISELLEDAIAAKLGEPTRDPHGDPIPGRDGSVIAEASLPLSTVAVGASVRIARVPDSSDELLRYLADRGVRPGAEVTVSGADQLGGVLQIAVAGRQLSLALAVADAISVLES